MGLSSHPELNQNALLCIKERKKYLDTNCHSCICRFDLTLNFLFAEMANCQQKENIKIIWFKERILCVYYFCFHKNTNWKTRIQNHPEGFAHIKNIEYWFGRSGGLLHTRHQIIMGKMKQKDNLLWVKRGPYNSWGYVSMKNFTSHKHFNDKISSRHFLVVNFQ